MFSQASLTTVTRKTADEGEKERSPGEQVSRLSA
jgi:hypothetical protein